MRARPALEIDSPLAADFAELLALDGEGTKPVNYQRRTADQIATLAGYAVQIAKSYRAIIENVPFDLAGKDLLEIGPGEAFGTALIVGEKCRRVGVADAYLAPWQADFHPALYRAIQKLLEQAAWRVNEVVARGAYDGAIDLHPDPASAMSSVASGSFDIVLSNAVLEHVAALDEVVSELFRITRPGGIGVHQIDFRNHKNFALPLEHLLLSPHDFDHVSLVTHREVGCQTRVVELADLFMRGGFEFVSLTVNDTAAPAYLAEFEPRLRRSRSAYATWDMSELAKTGALMIVRRPLQSLSQISSKS